LVVSKIRQCVAGGLAVVLDVAVDGGGESRFAGSVAVSGVGPVGEGERGRVGVVVGVGQAEGFALMCGR
jgi:hypothetical protein